MSLLRFFHKIPTSACLTNTCICHKSFKNYICIILEQQRTVTVSYVALMLFCNFLNIHLKLFSSIYSNLNI